MIKTDLFTPDILHSYSAFQNFFKAESEVREIRSLAKAGKLESYGSRLVNQPWELAAYEAFSIIHHYVLTIFFKQIAAIFDCVGAKGLARRCTVVNSFHRNNLPALSAFKRFKEGLVATARNTHRLDTGDVYLQSPVNPSLLRDRRVQDRAFPTQETPEIEFYHDEGACRGICYWFYYLYFSTKDAFEDPTSHIIAVTRQFQDGASRQAALVHSFYDTETPLLNLQKEVFRMPFAQFNIPGRIENLDPGAYSIGLPVHRINYIKISQDLGYIFDPNYGSIEFKGPSHSQGVRSYINAFFEGDNSNENIWLTHYLNPSSASR